MSHVTACIVNQNISVKVNKRPATSGHALLIRVGDDVSVWVSREEAAQLAADLLNAAGVTPVDDDHAAMLRDSIKQVAA